MDLKERWLAADAAVESAGAGFDSEALRVRSEINLEIVELARMAGFVVSFPLWDHVERKLEERATEQKAAA